MKFQTSVFFIITLVVFSCRANQDKEIEQIDELIIELHSTDDKFKKIDTLTLFEIHSKVQADLKEIHHIADTLDRTTVVTIEQAYQHISKISNAVTNYHVVASELDFLKTQLNNLKNDASNGLFDSQKLNELIINEKNNLQNLNQMIDSTYLNTNDYLEQTKKGQPVVDSVLNYYR